MARPKTLIRKSQIHGKGVYAGENIAKGTIVGRYTSRKVTKRVENEYVLYFYDPDTGEEMERWLGTGKFKYVNHSTKANLEMEDDTFEFVAVRNIADGEELTWYYGDEYQADLENN
jgi:SET domain-containing protein